MRIRVLCAIVLAMSVVGSIPAAVSAGPPERSEEPIFTVFADTENQLAVFWNITREDLCDWAEGGFVGPPPVQRLVSAQTKETGQGAVVASFQATSHLELWQLDSDVPPFVDPCVDTDEQVAPWAVGSAHVEANDNDLHASQTRTNSFGIRGQGAVRDAEDDAWHYSWALQALIDRDGNFDAVSEQFNLRATGR